MNEMNAVLSDVRLRFNIEHPSYEECYGHGYESAVSEIQLEDNPFKTGTAAYAQWSEGWWDGFYGEQPLFAEAIVDNSDDSDIAANDHFFHGITGALISKWVKITGAIAVSAMVGYQILDLVA